MKQGKSLSDLAAELERQMKTKKDYLATTNAIALNFDNVEGTRLALEGVGRFEVAETCHDQIASRLAIPSKYYDRMKSEAPVLLVNNVNYWLREANEKRMIRTLDGRARAFLSDRYRPLDNFDLAEAVLPRLTELDCRVESCELTEKRLYIKAVCPTIEGEVEVGDIVQAGVVISNSEIGCGSLSVEPLAFRLICRNGAISLNTVRKYHVGKRADDVDLAAEFFRSETRKQDDKAFFMKVQDLVAGTLSKEGFASIIDGYRRAKNIKIEADPVKVVEVFSKQNDLADTERGGVLKYLVNGGDLSLYGLMNAVTRFAQDVEDYDRATDLERIGGAVVEMSDREAESLVAVR